MYTVKVLSSPLHGFYYIKPPVGGPCTWCGVWYLSLTPLLHIRCLKVTYISFGSRVVLRFPFYTCSLELGLGRELNIPVGIVPLEELSLSFKLRMLGEGVVLVEKLGFYEYLYQRAYNENQD
jgi:hypothetical protein